MSSSNDIGTNEVSFNAVRQFLVAPDKRYQVRLHADCLYFRMTGSQFNRDWLLKGLEAGIASKVLPHWVLSRLMRLARGPRKTLILTGIGLLSVSLLLLALLISGAPPPNTTGLLALKFRRQVMLVLPVLFVLLIAGFVFSIVGFLSEEPTANSKIGSRQDFRLPVSRIAKARLVKGEGGIQAQLRAGGGQVALLELCSISGKQVRLAIPTATDLKTVERHLSSRLGARMTIDHAI